MVCLGRDDGIGREELASLMQDKTNQGTNAAGNFRLEINLQPV